MSITTAILVTGVTVIFATWAILLLIALLIFYLRRGDTAPAAGEPGIQTLDDAFRACAASRLQGWDQVEYAQKMVARHMRTYGFWNSFDTPQRAFERRMGYCWQRASALESILADLGFQVEKVHTFINRFPVRDRDGETVGTHTSGHVWLRVHHGGVRKDVCPGDEHNVPGRVHFRSMTPVFKWGPGILALTFLGVPAANLIWGTASWLKKRALED